MAFIAPKVIGGKMAKTPVEGDGIQQMADCIELKERTVQTFGNDVLITGLVDSLPIDSNS